MIKITWLGTASILIEACGQKLLFDPFVELEGGSNPNTLEDFEGVSDICVTHGHLDHLCFIPELAEGQDATVHCPAAAARTLEGFLEDNGNVILTRPGDSWRLGDLRITAYRGKHVSFSPSLVLGRLFSPRLFSRPKNLLFLAWAHPRFRERGDTLVYEIEAEGKRILLLGSMALEESAAYPEGADLLILLSDIDGLYTDDPRQNPDARFIDLVEELSEAHLNMGKKSTGSSVGTGGMNTKLTAAQIATRSGADMLIANSRDVRILHRLMDGQNLGTLFVAHRDENFDLPGFVSRLNQ